MVMKEHLTQCNSGPIDEFLIVFGQQWSFIAQTKIYQAVIHTQYFLVDTDLFTIRNVL